jgi:hypothetical protein
LMLMAFVAHKADAEPRIKVGCKVYATNQVDPIAGAQHLHRQIGNTSTTNRSTGESLLNSPRTSCNQSWLTSAGWFPEERNESVSRVAIYYRAPGDQRQIRDIPTGLQLLGSDYSFRCDNTSGEEPFQATPPSGCRAGYDTRVHFPDCWNQQSLQETTLVNSRNGVCPSSHSYRIPKINYLIQHDNADNRVANPLQVSAGLNAWEPYTFMHADYFAANQPVFNDKLLDLCLRNVSDNTSGGFGQPDECGVGVRE